MVLSLCSVETFPAGDLVVQLPIYQPEGEGSR